MTLCSLRVLFSECKKNDANLEVLVYTCYMPEQDRSNGKADLDVGEPPASRYGQVYPEQCSRQATKYW